jgi:hypothetical protein
VDKYGYFTRKYIKEAKEYILKKMLCLSILEVHLQICLLNDRILTSI